jgi:hypothetical protein
MWKTSIYGSYAQFSYSTAASTVIGANLAGTGTVVVDSASADWNMWQIGSRTVWTPVANLDLSVVVLYTQINTGFEGTTITPLPTAAVPAPTTATFRDKSIVSAIFRAQRNFWP